MLSCRAVLFDLDGTLVDAVPDIAEAARAMLAELGEAPRSDAEIAGFIGQGVAVLAERALTVGRTAATPARIALAVESFRRHYARTNGQRANLYPQAAEVLVGLRQRGFKLACVTNKAEAFTLPLLDMLGLGAAFDCVVSGDTLPQRKPAPEPLWHACAMLGVAVGEAVMVGDSDNDSEAAMAAGLPFVQVTHGHGAPVDRAQCAALVSGLTELLPILGASVSVSSSS